MPGLSEWWGSGKIRLFLTCRAQGCCGDSIVDIHQSGAGWSMMTASEKAPAQYIHLTDIGQSLLSPVLWILRRRPSSCSWKLSVSLGNRLLALQGVNTTWKEAKEKLRRCSGSREGKLKLAQGGRGGFLGRDM